MNLEQIKAVVEAYRPTTASDDMARLEFFEGIWQIQQRHADAAGQAIDPSTLPGKDELLEWYWACKPFLRQVPAAVDARRLAACAREIASYLIEKGSFSEGACGYLKGLRWRSSSSSLSTWRGRIPRVGLRPSPMTSSTSRASPMRRSSACASPAWC